MGEISRRKGYSRWIPAALMVLGGLVALKWALAIVLNPLVLLAAAGIGAYFLLRDNKTKALPAAEPAQKAAPTSQAERDDLAEFDRRLREAERAVETSRETRR